MFQKTSLQLTFAYVGVLTVILSVFIAAVRITFTRNLNQQLTVRLENLAIAATFNMDIEDGELDVDDDEILVRQEQVIEWFDLQGNLVAQQGNYQVNTPIRSITQPVQDLYTKEVIGYVRVSESLSELHNTLRQLDYGLGSGLVMAILLSAIGGIWLTHRAMQPIESSFQRLKQFTADASHELRSPLMAIKTNASVALKYPKGIRATDVEKFEAIASATNQMTQLTESLLLLARADQANTLQKHRVNISLILFNIIQVYEPRAYEQSIICQKQLEKDLYIWGDETLFKQLFTNLLQNALYYTPAGGLVIIEASKANSKFIVIKVRDTGIGIAPEHLDQIFERFWRVDKSRSYQDGKSGLGLAIAKEIVKLHQGTIFVESQLGIGSCFTVCFPIKSFLT